MRARQDVRFYCGREKRDFPSSDFVLHTDTWIHIEPATPKAQFASAGHTTRGETVQITARRTGSGWVATNNPVIASDVDLADLHFYLEGGPRIVEHNNIVVHIDDTGVGPKTASGNEESDETDPDTGNHDDRETGSGASAPA